jgi:hypothetical protein
MYDLFSSLKCKHCTYNVRIHTTSVELERYACVLRLLSMKEKCQNLVRSVVQREDLQIQKENTGKVNRMLNNKYIFPSKFSPTE